jgi:mannose/fructose/N-acetylgalactosamine-specific phosphotransferase system component IIB
VGVELFRIDDRLIHGQVVVGWGQPLDLAFIVLVDDEVASSDWEQELYRIGVPPEMEVFFESVESASEKLPQYIQDPRPGLLLTGDIETMQRLAERTAMITKINLGGIHYRAGRIQRMRYIFLSREEENALRALASKGIAITAQDVPAAKPLALDAVLAGEGT